MLMKWINEVFLFWLKDLSWDGDDDALHRQEVRGAGSREELRRLLEASFMRWQRVPSSHTSQTFRWTTGGDFFNNIQRKSSKV